MYKALIVDDERPVRVAIEKLGNWASYGIEIPLQAANGREALEMMRLHEPDVIFLDIQMPIMNGIEFLSQAKEEYPASQFIIVSGYDDFSYAQSAVRYGATDYLLKPLEKDALNLAIEHALQKIASAKNDETIKADATASGASSKELSTEEIIDTIKEYIDNNYGENIRISMFSDRYFFSKEYLSKNFKAKYGYSIYEYVLKVRMETAYQMLQNPEIKIQDIALKVGFTDNNYFSKAFKNYHGYSPTECRSGANANELTD